MDRLVTSLTVGELCGLFALMLFMFYTAGLLLRYRPDDVPRAGFLFAAAVIAGPAIYMGLRVLFPGFP